MKKQLIVIGILLLTAVFILVMMAILAMHSNGNNAVSNPENGQEVVDTNPVPAIEQPEEVIEVTNVVTEVPEAVSAQITNAPPGPVIVHDSGATFSVAPASKTQLKIPTEQEVLALQKR